MPNHQHVVTTKDGKWGVRGEGNKKLTKKTDTQEEAIARAKEIAKNKKSELLVHSKKGKIRTKTSYGNDDRRTNG